MPAAIRLSYSKESHASREVAMRLSRLLLVLPALAMALACGNALAQTWPSKPIKLVVSSGAGSSPDIQARLFTQVMAERHGYVWVIENAAGAGGNIAAERVAKAAPDGYTLLLASAGPLYFNRSLYPKLTYDIMRDFDPVTQVAHTPNILAVYPGLPIKNVRELIAYAKANPGKLRYGSPGSGSSQHLSGELFNSMAGVEMQHVPYKSSAQMTTELVSGQFEISFQNAPLVLPFLKSGKLRALAVTSMSRLPAAPEVPTVNESGVPGFDVGGGTGLLAPRGTPPAILKKLEADVREAVTAVREQYQANGLVAAGNTAAEFAAALKAENERWAPVVKATGAQVD
jgi:tripartite-type tricarboxylate transporter receptor subunit TctC